MPTAVNLNGSLVSPESAKISIFDHGFLYGDSVYETLRVYRGRCFQLEPHLLRLEASASAIGLGLPLALEGLFREVERTVAAAAEPELSVRVMVTRGEGPIGLDPRLCPAPSLIVIARPYEALPPEAYSAGVRVVVARTFRNSPRSLDPGIKTGNFLNNILAAREAHAQDAFEALMLSADGGLAEGTQSNVFLVREGRLVTPDPQSGLLRGITRELVLALSREAGIPVEERAVFWSEIFEADEMFLTSTLKEVVPVRAIGKRLVGDGRPGPVSERVRRLYSMAVESFLAAGAPRASSSTA